MVSGVRRSFHRIQPMASLELISSNKSFGGVVRKYAHISYSTQTRMQWNVFLPSMCLSESNYTRVPVAYWLSGLTCTEDNMMHKAGAQRIAERLGIAIVCPDTSPRGLSLPGEHDSYDFGAGAGFYVDAQRAPWDEHYRMFTYVTEELPALVESNLPVWHDRRAIFGHSMGGHGALVAALKCPGKYVSVSAFAPIAHPSACVWGRKAFTGYLGDNERTWKDYDATELIRKYSGPTLPILIDQGVDDQYHHEKQLCPEDLRAAATQSQYSPFTMRMQPGYDHSYYFIATFIEEHLEFHSKQLHARR